MKQILHRMLAVSLIILGAVNASAQIAPKVAEILKKSEEVMNNPKGIEITMTIDVRMMIKLSGSTMTIASKGNKSRSKVVTKTLGQEITIEGGFDGTQKWKYKHMNYKKNGNKLKEDTLTIEKTTKKPKSNDILDFDFDKDYKKASMKLDGRYYVLTFTDPIKKDDPKKQILKIDKEKYYVRELKVKEDGTTATMTVTKIKIGVSDDVFKFNINDYSDAVVIRK